MEQAVFNKFRLILIDVLKAFDEFCTRHNLSYFACAGTAIGAIRHHDIIPWDDDIDVYMPRTDYEKLMKIRSELESSDYSISTLGDKDYIYPFAKFYSKKTTLIEYRQFPNCCLGIYIDIFPLDEVAGSFAEIEKKKDKFEHLFSRFQDTYYDLTFDMILVLLRQCEYNNLFNKIRNRFYSDIQKENERNAFINFENKWKQEKGDLLLTHHGTYPLRKELLNKEWFKSYYYVPFGSTKIRVSNGILDYLTHLYGDYMTPPPISEQRSHHGHYYLNLIEGLSIEQVKERIKKGEHTVY